MNDDMPSTETGIKKFLSISDLLVLQVFPNYDLTAAIFIYIFSLANLLPASRITRRSARARSLHRPIYKRPATNCTDSSCQVKCSECNICIHQYVCNCPDSLIQSTICKHVHLLQRFLLQPNNPTENGDGSSPIFDTNSVHEDEVTYKHKEIKLVEEHLKLDAGPPKDIQSLRQRLRETLLVLADRVMTCDNKSSLQELEKQVNSARHLFSSMNKNKPLKHLEVTRQFPGNKKIETQLRFHSTKKKRKLPKNVRFSKPRTTDINKIFSKSKEHKEGKDM